MVSKNTTETEQQSELSKGLEFAAYPLSAAVGVHFVNEEINDQLYNNLKSLKLLPQVNRHLEHFRSNAASMGAETAGKLPEFHEKFTSLYNDRLKGLGFTDFNKRYEGLHSNQKLDAIIKGFTAAGVTLGVMLTIANAKGLMDKVRRKDDQDRVNTL